MVVDEMAIDEMAMEITALYSPRYHHAVLVLVLLQTDSGVSAQPMSDAETLQGAINRARRVLALCPEATYGTGVHALSHKSVASTRT